jgi:protein-S-isoprenylcysteine O-methyltransferase Ste14
MLLDGLAAVCLLVWSYEVIAYGLGLSFHVGPEILHRKAINHTPLQWFGGVLACLGLIIYGLAVRQLGVSWRLGIDRKNPGPLVTHGVYRWSRHPIYVAFDLLFVGAFFVLDRPMLLAVAVVWVSILHTHMLREERFLAQVYGQAYGDYSRRVRRYF